MAPVPAIVPLLALVAGLLSAAAAIFIRQGLRTSDPYTGFWINVVVGAVGLWTAVLVTGRLGRVSPAGLAFFALAGLIGTVGGRLTRFLAIESVGASITSALGNLNPLVATGLAILLLGEHVTVPIVTGTLVITLGTILLSWGGRRIGFRPRLLVLPLISAACFGVVSILRKLGLSDMGPVMGAAVNITAAFIAFAAFLLASGQRTVMACRGRSLAYFVAAGLAENTGVFLNIVALGLGTVSVVTPLYGASPIFVLLLSFFFLRGIEVLSGRVIAGTLLIVLGVYLITALSGH